MQETSQTSAVAMEDAQNRRIAAMRERKEARRQRFLNARERTIGVRLQPSCRCRYVLYK